MSHWRPRVLKYLSPIASHIGRGASSILPDVIGQNPRLLNKIVQKNLCCIWLLEIDFYRYIIILQQVIDSNLVYS